MIIPGQFGFNYPSGFREEAFWNIFPMIEFIYKQIFENILYVQGKSDMLLLLCMIDHKRNTYFQGQLYFFLQTKLYNKMSLKIPKG